MLVLWPLWSLLIAGRGVWTPDEPREFDLALNMLQAPAWWMPTFLGAPFCEKPPLTYWASALAMNAFGPSPMVARLPNLLWATLTFVAMLALGRGLAGPRRARSGGIAAAVAASTSVLALQCQPWLATDAPLYAATAVSLLGLWWGLDGSRQNRRTVGWVLFWLGTTLAFFAKNSFGWMVPAFTLLGWIAWMRRPAELLRPGLWAAGLGTVLIVGFWIAGVARQPGGDTCLSDLLWGNSMGRLLPIDTPQNYALGHRNTFTKYLLQLPWTLFPWTIVFAASAATAFRSWRRRDPGTGAWAFCLVATVPAWLVLLVSATGRNVYFLPSLVGVSAAVGLWFARLNSATSRLDRLALPATEALVGLLCVLLAAVTWLLGRATPSIQFTGWWALPLVAAAVALWVITRQLRSAETRVLRIPLVLLLSVALAAPLLFPAMDRIQDLSPVVRAARPFLDSRVVTFGDEETIQACLEAETGLKPRVLRDAEAVGHLLGLEPGLRVLVRSDRDSLRRWLLPSAREQPERESRDVESLKRLGLVVLQGWQIEGGRHYVLMGLSS